MIEILLVEDDEGDIELTLEAFNRSKVALRVNVVRDGIEALDYLQKKGEFETARTPDLMLLDLNLPRKDGREVLTDMQESDRFKQIPVVVLTTSDADEDILKSYKIGANAYVTKPVGLKGLVKVVNLLEDFWFTIVKLPPHDM
ncbi:response regulator [Acaryochloris marina]|uniref:Response regulator n=1 Tax=Acaryochloris marina (strain MBIC 11017) TaxID=329726 RepID=B0C1K1_ACAM1|nr:response regulator [Acaryochloris marina]ABW30835.1 response regulator [Acaryochloris marina MBIC11017]BDM79585.1 response regulator [Acaryochloris marina MBIC10699]